MATSDTQSYGPGRLEEALAEYEAARDAGRPVDRREFLARHADVATELAPLLEAGEQVEALTRPLREALDGPRPQPLPRPPGYEILEEIDHGGMGVVYKARQQGTEQLVALKMMRPDWFGGLDGDARRQAVGQFFVEVKAAARLRHPNRVRILHMGEYEGRPFFAMELIEGRSLAKAKRPEGVSKAAAVKYLASVAEAVHEAHQHGILHRDLKPHNILIDERGDEGLLADFGLAKMNRPATDDAEGNGQSVRSQERIAGTYPYMSPEQTRDADAVTAASDVYGLGATLYELLTGRPPFEGKSREELVEKIRNEKPTPPRTLRPDVSPAVERICLKCLEKDPARRYGTALELAGALRRYLLDIHHARNYATMGTLLVGLGPVVLLMHLAVYLLLQIHFHEGVIWLLMFAMYPGLFAVFLLAPPAEAGQQYTLARREMWSIWGGKFFAAVAVSIALRSAFAGEPERAMVLVYPALAAMAGMALFALGAKMKRGLHLFLATTAWLTAVVIPFRLDWAPLMYGVFVLICNTLYGLYLRRLGKELQ
jgi:serine/threonine-protein kinase